MTQIVLKLLRGNIFVSAIATAVGYIVRQFEDAYQCDGPVVLDALSFSAQYLWNMERDQPICEWRTYSYKGPPGCNDNEPFNLTPKNSVYRVRRCVVRRAGESTAGGAVYYPRSAANSNRLEWLNWHLLTLGIGILALPGTLFC
jgi:hypothetical protein